MKTIGVTGGIGSGKSVVCDIFKILGTKIYNADIRAKEILNTNATVKQEISKNFGSEIYHSGKADRNLLAGIVFNNQEKLSILNSIIHPAVAEDFDVWMESNRNEDYIIKEAAILFETGTFKLLDKIVLVYSPEEVRIQRVIERDNTGRDAVLARMKSQMDDIEKMKLSDYIIYNDTDHSLIKQVVNLHNIFKT